VKLLTVEMLYRWILLRRCIDWWTNPWRDLDFTDEDWL
jgi:hypothetical protein